MLAGPRCNLKYLRQILAVNVGFHATIKIFIIINMLRYPYKLMTDTVVVACVRISPLLVACLDREHAYSMHIVPTLDYKR